MKHQYNQGDIIQFKYSDGSRDLLVITEVFEVLGSLRYLIHWLRDNGIKILEECSFHFLSRTTKIFVNGAWIGVHRGPQLLIEKMSYIPH